MAVRTHVQTAIHFITSRIACTDFIMLSEENADPFESFPNMRYIHIF